jgi:DNA-binding NarL/FixJ family response regulator
MPTEVLLADDHPVIRHGFRLLLENEGGFTIVGEASDGQQAIRLAGRLHPDVAVLDLSMPFLNGLDAARGIQKKSPTTCNLLLTVHSEEAYVHAALQAGIRGYVVKTQAPADLVHAIHEVLQGRIYLSSQVSQFAVGPYLVRTELPGNALSQPERQVLQLFAKGKTAKEIADVLSVSVRTTESYRARIMKKLGIHTTKGLVLYAVRKGIVEP